MSFSEESTDCLIKDLEPRSSRINVKFKVVSKEDPREVTSRRTEETHSVCDVTVADETGSIILSLWDDDIDFVQEDNTYQLVNGYVNIFQDSMRLSKGKYGELQASEEAIEEVALEPDRSAEHHPRPRRRYGGGGGYGRGGGGGYNRDRRGGGGGYRRGGGNRQRQSGYNDW